MLYILDKLIVKYQLKPPFLDVGCGTGYASKYFANKGWGGKAIDISASAIEIARKNLISFKMVKIAREGISNKVGKFNTIILFDVIEHIEDDEQVLKKIYQLLNPNGYILLALTSNPKEWRWDDEFYGHYRRYSKNDIKTKLKKTGFDQLEFVEYTFPIFWLIRRIYTSILRPPKVNFQDKAERTSMSAVSSSWSIPFLLSAVEKLDFLWKIIFFLQYLLFKRFTSWGFAMLVIARKPK